MYVHLFDFTVKHVHGADVLSRLSYANGDGAEDETVDNYFNVMLYSIQV